MDGFRSGSMFCIVDFVGGRKRTVVPDTWLSINDTLCLLPPNATDSDLEVLARNLAEPGEGWQMLEVSSLETFENYSEAKKQLDKFKETSQSETSSQRKRKKPSYLEDYTTHDSDDGRRPYTVFGIDFDEEAMSENEWIPPPEFIPRVENVSSVKKTIRNDHRPMNHRFSQSELSSQKENIDITCDCQSSCHNTFLKTLHGVQKQLDRTNQMLDRTNQMVQQLLGGQKQTHSQLKRILQSQPVNQMNGQEEMDVFSQDSTSFVQCVFQNPSTSTAQKSTEIPTSFSASEDIYITGDQPSTAEKCDDFVAFNDGEDDESASENNNKIVVKQTELIPTPSEQQYFDSVMLAEESTAFGEIWPSFSRQWPDHVEIPTGLFSKALLDDLNAEKDLSWDRKRELVEHMANYAYSFKPYPSKSERIEVCEAIVRSYPYLKNTYGVGIGGWEMTLLNKLKKLRQRDTSLAVRLNRMKNTSGSNAPINEHINPKRGELNWAPDHMPGETEESVLCHKRVMLEESLKPLKDQDTRKVSLLMSITYSFRREKINAKVPLSELKEEYPMLFQINEQFNEFHRLTSVNIHETFLQEAARQGPRLCNVFQKRKKTDHESNLFSKFCEDCKRLDGEKQCTAKEAFGIFIIPYLLKEDIDSIFKLIADGENVSDYESSYPKIFFSDQFVNSTYIIMCEGLELNRTDDFVDAVCLLMSFYYTLAIDYAPPVISTLKFLQNNFLKIKNTALVPSFQQTNASFIDVPSTSKGLQLVSLENEAEQESEALLDSLLTPVKSGRKRKKKPVSKRCQNFPLPEFSNTLKPLLEGEILLLEDHAKLSSQLKEELISFLNRENLICRGNTSALRWEYKKLGETLASKYPKMMWDLPSDRQKKIRKESHPIYTVFIRRLSQRRKMQRVRLKAKGKETENVIPV